MNSLYRFQGTLATWPRPHPAADSAQAPEDQSNGQRLVGAACGVLADDLDQALGRHRLQLPGCGVEYVWVFEGTACAWQFLLDTQR
jgi:hypothetical protein